MTTTKKAAKKATTKRVAKAASTKITLKDNTLYLVSQRNKLLGWEPAGLYPTREQADAVRRAIEERSVLTFLAAKVDRVKLFSE